MVALAVAVPCSSGAKSFRNHRDENGAASHLRTNVLCCIYSPFLTPWAFRALLSFRNMMMTPQFTLSCWDNAIERPLRRMQHFRFWAESPESLSNIKNSETFHPESSRNIFFPFNNTRKKNHLKTVFHTDSISFHKQIM